VIAARLAIFAALLSAAPRAVAAEELRNWFDDPWFQARGGYPDCPLPRGPFSTREEMLRETHHRSERGTRCWLEKRCAKPSAYMYDRDIAAAIRARFEASAALADASLWVTVQGRYAWVEGCVRSDKERRDLGSLMRGIPDLDLMTINVSVRRGAPPPYYTRNVY
jgi:hypothetical protein